MLSLQVAQTVRQSDKDLLLEVKRLIGEKISGAQVVLYGSVARGASTQESDYDVLVLTPRELSTSEEDAVYDAVYALDLERDVVVSVLFYSRAEWNSAMVKASPFRKNVLREGYVV